MAPVLRCNISSLRAKSTAPSRPVIAPGCVSARLPFAIVITLVVGPRRLGAAPQRANSIAALGRDHRAAAAVMDAVGEALLERAQPRASPGPGFGRAGER